MNKDFGFLILCPEINYALARVTVGSIKSIHPDASIKIVVPAGSPKNEILDMAKLANVIPSEGDTVTGMMNNGLKASDKFWNFILVGGARVTNYLINKYLYFTKSDKDVLFSVVDRKMYFHDCSLNGIFMNKKSLAEVGKLPDDCDDILLSKLVWANNAIDKGYKFKAITSAKFM